MQEKDIVEVDGLCPECGHAFKAHIDRVLGDDKNADQRVEEPCPVCGCGECKIGK